MLTFGSKRGTICHILYAILKEAWRFGSTRFNQIFRIISRLNGSKCCGQTQYFPRKQQCCNDVIINKSAKYCCDNKITDFSPSEICCKGVVTDKNEDDRCCGDTGLYNKQTQGCCIDTIYELDTQICCGGKNFQGFFHQLRGFC